MNYLWHEIEIGVEVTLVEDITASVINFDLN